MEHIIITTLSNGMLRLEPEAGYILYNDYTGQRYAEAIVKNTAGFRAVLSGIQPTPHERTLEDAKTEKLAALKAYDASTAVSAVSETNVPTLGSFFRNAAKRKNITSIPSDTVKMMKLLIMVSMSFVKFLR